jgi:hypothetical protein
MITSDENEGLQKRFSENEIKEVVFGSYARWGPGLMVSLLFFYQKLWDVIKYLLEMFNEYFEGNLDIYRVKFAMITLIPKENDARSIKKFRPIFLINYSFNFFTKTMTNIYALVIDGGISSCQTAFIRGIFILNVL